MRNKIWLGLILLISCSISMADTNLKPFQSDSLDKIVKDRNGQGFIMVLWSIDCPPCFKELSQLQQLRDQFPKGSLVLIATDGEEHADSVQKVLKEFQLDQMDNWVFADTTPERLRYVIDSSWYGELPRAYIYEESHKRHAHSGNLSGEKLQQWLATISP